MRTLAPVRRGSRRARNHRPCGWRPELQRLTVAIASKSLFDVQRRLHRDRPSLFHRDGLEFGCQLRLQIDRQRHSPRLTHASPSHPLEPPTTRQSASASLRGERKAGRAIHVRRALSRFASTAVHGPHPLQRSRPRPLALFESKVAADHGVRGRSRNPGDNHDRTPNHTELH